MAKIEWQKMPPRNDGDGAGEARLFPRLVDNGTVDFNTICNEVAAKSVFSRGELMSAFVQVVDGMRRHLAEGRTVDVPDMGTFRLSLGTEGIVSESTRQRLSRVRVEGVSYHASEAMLSGIGRPDFQNVSQPSSTQPPTAQQLIPALTDYLTEHGCITRRTAERLFGFRRATASERLRELTLLGFLQAEGENRHRVYRLK